MTNPHSAPSTTQELVPLRVLAALLERLEHSSVPVDPDQYASVARRLEEILRSLEPTPAVRELLARHPAACEMYENTRYEVAGLCCSPLDQSIAAEQSARAAIHRVMHKQTPRESSANGQS